MKIVAWTGGSKPTAADKASTEFKRIRSHIFREHVKNCGGLDFWKCAGTGWVERARIFWGWATLDAWATIQAE